MTRQLLELVAACVATGLFFLLPALDAAADTFVVYGASGSVGGAIVEEALSRGHEVIGVSRPPASLQRRHSHFSAVQGDVTDVYEYVSLPTDFGVIYGNYIRQYITRRPRFRLP